MCQSLILKKVAGLRQLFKNTLFYRTPLVAASGKSKKTYEIKKVAKLLKTFDAEEK